MALINCSECKREISDMATACPYCGFPMSSSLARSNTAQVSSKKERRGCLELTGIAVLIFVVITIIAMFNSNDDLDVGTDIAVPTPLPNTDTTQVEELVNNESPKALGYIPPIGEEIQSRDSAKFTLLDIKFKGSNVIITTQRDGKSGRSYSTREVMCPSKKARYLATGDSMEEFKSSNMKQSFSESFSDSIQGEIASYACTQLLLKNLEK